LKQFCSNRTDQTEVKCENRFMKRQLSYEDILDSVSHTRSEYTHRPRSVGTVDGKATFLNSNASDPCLLSSLTYATSDISTKNSKLFANQSPEDTQGTNSMDSGIPGEMLSMQNQVN
jgi:hypothetical protein